MPLTASVSKFRGRVFSVLYVTAGCVGALVLYQFAVGQYTMTQLGDRWIAEYPLLGIFGPLFAIALASGMFVGVALGVLAGSRSLPVAAWAGLFACVSMITAAAVAGSLKDALTSITLITAPLIAAGLLLGAIVGRKLRHA